MSKQFEIRSSSADTRIWHFEIYIQHNTVKFKDQCGWHKMYKYREISMSQKRHCHHGEKTKYLVPSSKKTRY